MLNESQYDECFCWRKNADWYEETDDSYEARLTDAAPQKARDSFASYKRMVDKLLSAFDATPYDGIRFDF